MKKQAGFTLIELVMVIVILGILAAVALPKFTDLSTDARVAAMQGVAGALSGGNTTNIALRSLHANSGVIVADCNQAGGLLEGGLPAGYAITAGAITSGATATCTLAASNVTPTATFSATRI